MQRSSPSLASTPAERDADPDLLSKDSLDLEKDADYSTHSNRYVPSKNAAEDMQDIVAYHRSKKRTHWCCRPVNFQRWFVVASLSALVLFLLGCYVYAQVVDFEIHYATGTSEMRENQRIGALERRERDLSAQIESLRHTINVLQEAFHETNPNYIFEKDMEE